MLVKRPNGHFRIWRKLRTLFLGRPLSNSALSSGVESFKMIKVFACLWGGGINNYRTHLSRFRCLRSEDPDCIAFWLHHAGLDPIELRWMDDLSIYENVHLLALWSLLQRMMEWSLVYSSFSAPVRRMVHPQKVNMAWWELIGVNANRERVCEHVSLKEITLLPVVL